VDVINSTFDGTGACAQIYLDASVSTATVRSTIRGSRFTNGYGGVGAESFAAGAVVNVSISNSEVARNNMGIYTTGSGAKVLASGNTVSHNATGMYQASSGVFETAGNNAVRNNGTNSSGTITNVGAM